MDHSTILLLLPLPLSVVDISDLIKYSYRNNEKDLGSTVCTIFGNTNINYSSDSIY